MFALAGLNVAIARAQRLAWLVVTVSLTTPAGRSRRYSELKPLVVSLIKADQPAPRVKVWPPAILYPSFVMASSNAWLVAPAVEIVAVVVDAPTARVPV